MKAAASQLKKCIDCLYKMRHKWALQAGNALDHLLSEWYMPDADSSQPSGSAPTGSVPHPTMLDQVKPEIPLFAPTFAVAPPQADFSMGEIPCDQQQQDVFTALMSWPDASGLHSTLGTDMFGTQWNQNVGLEGQMRWQ